MFETIKNLFKKKPVKSREEQIEQARAVIYKNVAWTYDATVKGLAIKKMPPDIQNIMQAYHRTIIGKITPKDLAEVLLKSYNYDVEMAEQDLIGNGANFITAAMFYMNLVQHYDNQRTIPPDELFSILKTDNADEILAATNARTVNMKSANFPKNNPDAMCIITVIAQIGAFRETGVILFKNIQKEAREHLNAVQCH